MRTIKELNALISDRPETEIVFVPFFAKDEADEYVEEHYEAEPFTDTEWATICERLSSDNGLWTELIECWNHYLDKAISERNKGNVNSK